MSTETNAKSDEAIIRQMIDDWSRALEAGDAEALTVNYTEDSVLFDACPPYKTVGKAGIKQVWEQCLPYFPEKFVSEHRDLQVEVSGDLAFVYGLHHFIPDPPDHPADRTGCESRFVFAALMASGKFCTNTSRHHSIR